MIKMFASSLYVQTHGCRLLNFSFQYKTMLKVYVTKKKTEFVLHEGNFGIFMYAQAKK